MEPLLLLPGMMCDERLWAPQISALAPHTSSIRVADLAGSDSIGAMAESVLDNAPATFSLAGLSMGGIVAFEIWRRAPQRVLRLALLDTNARAELPERKQARQGQMERAMAGELERLMREELKPNYLAEANRTRPGLLETVMNMALELGPEVFCQQSRALRDRADSVTTLTEIDCPTLVLCGADDELCPPAYHEQMASLLPRPRLVIVPGCGHLSTLEQPEAINSNLKTWLEQR